MTIDYEPTTCDLHIDNECHVEITGVSRLE